MTTNSNSDFKVCHVCDITPASAGGLSCGHGFCPDCFSRYVSGSILELDVSARCCVCGKITNLVKEISNDISSLTNYGRTGRTKLLLPVGIASFDNGDYVIADKGNKRVYVHNISGHLRRDFAYTYNTEPVGGIAVTPTDEIVIPTRDLNYDFVSYFTKSGRQMGCAFIKPVRGNRPNIQGITCDMENDRLYLSDSDNSCIHVISNGTKQQIARLNLQPIQYETTPKPHGISLTNDGDILITDTANHCIKIYGTNGDFKQKIGCQGNRPGQFKNPTGVLMTSQEELVIADRGNQRVQVLNANGEFQRYIVRFKAGYDVYMAPDDVIMSMYGEITVLMTSLQAAEVGEVRHYKY